MKIKCKTHADRVDTQMAFIREQFSEYPSLYFNKVKNGTDKIHQNSYKRRKIKGFPCDRATQYDSKQCRCYLFLLLLQYCPLIPTCH